MDKYREGFYTGLGLGVFVGAAILLVGVLVYLTWPV